MFENVLSSFKKSAGSNENFRSPRLRDNLNNIKYKIVARGDRDYVEGFLSPRAYGDPSKCASTDISWPESAEEATEAWWTTSNTKNVVEKFSKVITLNDDEYFQRRNDREEIRRRLAMGAEQDDYYMPSERPGRKPSLQSRLQSGMNLQICFMNDTASDTESPGSDTEAKGPVNSPNFTPFASKIKDDVHPIYNYNHPYQTKPLSVSIKQTPSDTTKPKTGRVRPSSLSLSSVPTKSSLSTAPLTEADFFARQARLQAEARMALAQAKEMARLQMEIERQKQQISPITEMLRASLQKAGIPLSPDRRRVSRQLLTDMNVAQLQIIVNELHTQIENLNDQLVQLLMARDELHMGQDSMLVDIEDLTRYLGAKEQSIKLPNALASSNSSDRAPPSMAVSSTVSNTYSSPVSLLRPKLHRIASLVKK